MFVVVVGLVINVIIIVIINIINGLMKLVHANLLNRNVILRFCDRNPSQISKILRKILVEYKTILIYGSSMKVTILLSFTHLGSILCVVATRITIVIAFYHLFSSLIMFLLFLKELQSL